MNKSKYIIHIKGNGKGKFLYSAVSNHSDYSKRFTLHPLTDLFIPRPSQLLWEAYKTLDPLQLNINGVQIEKVEIGKTMLTGCSINIPKL